MEAMPGRINMPSVCVVTPRSLLLDNSFYSLAYSLLLSVYVFHVKLIMKRKNHFKNLPIKFPNSSSSSKSVSESLISSQYPGVKNVHPPSVPSPVGPFGSSRSRKAAKRSSELSKVMESAVGEFLSSSN